MHLYIHIPFCIKKCLYCDFLSVSYDKEKVSLYVKSLLNDIRLSAKSLQNDNGSKTTLNTIYIGGGTPSTLTPDEITAVMNCIYDYFTVSENAEITVEVNPCTVTKEKLAAYKNAGINRISMGVQSFNDKTLKTLGRVHDALTAVKSYKMIRNAGFENVNLDLISCAPGDGGFGNDMSDNDPVISEIENYGNADPAKKFAIAERLVSEGRINSFYDSLNLMAFLSPEHISVYQLIIEEGTPFYTLYGNGSDLLPDEDGQADIYMKTSDFLKKRGYDHYEISNFSKPGYASRHNTAYWLQHDYIGCGSGASGTVYIKDENDHLCAANRYRKISEIPEYINILSGAELPETEQKTLEISENLTKSDLISEHIMLAMRMRPGFSPEKFEKLYGDDDDSVRQKLGENIRILEKYMPEFINFDGDYYSFTEKGFLVSNTILSELI